MRRNDDNNGRWSTIVAAITFVYLLATALLAAAIVVAVWPAPGGPVVQTRLGTLSLELRYLVLVVSGGGLGSSIQALSSFVDYVGNRRLKVSWLLWYLYRVPSGALIAIIFYFAMRGALLSPAANLNDLNPFGIAAVSGLVGMFSRQATDKLSEVFQTLFGQQTHVEREINRIGETLGLTTLGNYNGYACLELRDADGKQINSDSDVPNLQPGAKHEVLVWFQPTESKYGVSDEIRIGGGVDVREVEFLLTVDSDRVTVKPKQNFISVSVGSRSKDTNFEFTTPHEVSTFEIWVEISQKNRFLNLISQRVSVGSAYDASSSQPSPT